MTRPVRLDAARSGLARLDRVLRAHPEIRARTADYLRGDLPALTKDPSMEDQAIKIPGNLLEAAGELVPALERSPALRAYGRATRALVVRLALTRGLEVLRAELAAAAPE